MTPEQRKMLTNIAADWQWHGLCEPEVNAIRAALAELDAQAAELELLRRVANTLLAGSETLAVLDAREWKAKHGKETKP